MSVEFGKTINGKFVPAPTCHECGCMCALDGKAWRCINCGLLRDTQAAAVAAARQHLAERATRPVIERFDRLVASGLIDREGRVLVPEE